MSRLRRGPEGVWSPGTQSGPLHVAPMSMASADQLLKRDLRTPACKNAMALQGIPPRFLPHLRHLKPMKTNRELADADPLLAICGGGGINLVNSMGDAWTANYLKITGESEVDLRSNIAAEARAKITYERLIDFTDDPGSRDTLQFLMTREITHMKSFMLALDNLGLDPLAVGQIPPTAGLVDQFLHDSTSGDSAVGSKVPAYIDDGFNIIDDPALMEVDGPGTTQVMTPAEGHTRARQ